MAENPRTEEWSLALLVGGKGRRLGGRAKGNLRRGGSTLIARAMSFADHFHEALLVGDDQNAYPNVAARRVPDRAPGGGAPVGLLSAVAAARTPLVLIVPCDLAYPDVRPGYVLRAALQPGDDAACFVDTNGELQPFPGLVRASAASKLEAAYRPDISVYGLLGALNLTRFPLPDTRWGHDALADVDTWDDARALGVDDQENQ